MASQEAKKVHNAVLAHEESADPASINMPPGRDALGRFVSSGAGNEAAPLRSDNVDEQFPTGGLGARDPRDEIMEAKIASQDADQPGITPFGQLIAKDSDFEWLQKKREAEAYANFQAWFAQNFDKMSPPQKEMAKKLFPKFYQERLRQLDRTVELQRKLAKLKLLGPEDSNDLILQYAAEAGFIESDPLHTILHPEEAAKQKDMERRRQRYARGLFNPRRVTTTAEEAAIEARRKNAEGIFGEKRIPGDNNAAYNIASGKAGFMAGFTPGFTPATAAETPVAEPDDEPRPGLFSRILNL